MDKEKRQNLRKPNTVCCQCWYPKYRLTVLSTKFGVSHPTKPIVASSQKINQIIIITTLTLNLPKPILIFARQEEKIN